SLWGMDLDVFQAAGRAWLAGENPYDRSVLDRHFPREGEYLPAFASPPTTAPLYMAAGMLSETAAMRFLRVLNLIALALLGWLTRGMALEPITPGLVPAPQTVMWYFPALFAGSTFTLQTLWLGQVSLIGAAALQGAWYLERKQRPVVAGACLAIASIKPQLMM